jgi:hypothetical protein
VRRCQAAIEAPFYRSSGSRHPDEGREVANGGGK